MRMHIARQTKDNAAKAHARSQSPSTHAPEPRGVVASLLNLQRSQGNRFVQCLLDQSLRQRPCETKEQGSTPPIQTKLTISQPGDAYEQEADTVAKQVVQRQMSSSMNVAMQQDFSLAPVAMQYLIQRQQTSFPEDSDEMLEKEKQVQRKGESPTEVTHELEQRLTALAGSGQKLPEAVQRRMEEGFGVSFDRVQIHTDHEAAQLSRSLNAEAFTYGNDIYFGAYKFNPASTSGAELLAHELTHTLQQTGIQRKSIQRRGGTTVGQLEIQSNVVSAGLTAGHAWLAYKPTGGTRTTYGTWGNRTPIGLHRDLELHYPAAATRATDLDATDDTALTTFATANDAWSLINNCASFAARGWQAVTGESLSHKTFGIPNPSALGAGIVAANGGTTGTLVAAPPGAKSSSSL